MPLSRLKVNGVVVQENAIDALQEQNALTISTAFESGNLISRMFKEDEQSIFRMISNLIWLTNETLNVKHKLNDFQVIPIIELIKREYGELKIEEVAICFRNGVAGRYGSTMHRFDIEVVADWLLKFYQSEERWQYIENRLRPEKKPVQHNEIIEDLTQFVSGKKQETGFVNPNASRYIKELKESLLNIDINIEKKSQSTIITHITLEQFTERVEAAIKNMDNLQLEQLKQDYEKHKPKFYKTAVKLIIKKIVSQS